MTGEGWRAEQKVDALLRMIEEAGASPAGALPPGEYLGALREVEPGEADAVTEAHANDNAPPNAGGGN